LAASLVAKEHKKTIKLLCFCVFVATSMKQTALKELLNDESFIRWLQDEAAPEEQQTWDRWLTDGPEKQALVQKAGKIMTMPFVEKTPPDVEKELQELEDLREEIGKFQKKLKKQQ
jgi:succinate dehydrogenase/fumarate reductase flavoprotein subunit